MSQNGLRLSLGKRLRAAMSVRCIGVEPNWEDYPEEARQALRSAGEVFYPTPLYEDVFLSLGKKVFPANHIRFMGNKIKQTHLFQFLGISHPRTRLYYGRNRIEKIGRDFEYPFIAKTPVGSSRGLGVRLIEKREDLARYLEGHRPAYIQEYLPLERDLRVVLIRGNAIHAYWRIHGPGEFRNNVSRGAAISFEGIPEEALEFAEDAARRCRFAEVGLDVCHAAGRYYVIEANMVFGLEGFRRKGLDYYEMLARAVEDEEPPYRR